MADLNSQLKQHLSDKIATLSFMAAVLVVLIHIPKTLEKGVVYWLEKAFTVEGFSGIGVPFFFCVSGYMLARRTHEISWWKDALLKRIRTILVPYAIWCGITVVVLILIDIAGAFVHRKSLLKALEWVSLVNTLGLNPLCAPPTPYWYLRTLFFFVVLSPMMVLALRCNCYLGRLILLLLFAMDCITRYYFPFYRPLGEFFSWFCSFSGLFYFFAGMYLRYYPFSVRAEFSWMLCVVGFFSMCINIYFRFATDLRGVVSCVNPLAILCLLGGIWGVTPSFGLPTVFKGVAFPIYMMHYILIVVIFSFCKNAFPCFCYSFVGFTFMAFLSIGLCVLGFIAIKRLMPKTASVFFGGRV